MSEATIEALESEAYESSGEAYEGEGGEAYEGEGGEAYEGYGEDARSDARRRARQRQIVAARQRQAQLRRPPTPPPPRRTVVTAPSQRQTMAAIRSLDLDTKVELDSLRRALEKARRNGDLAMYSAVLSAVASQGFDTYVGPLKNHDIVRAFLRTAPLALLWPARPSKGAAGVLLHPAFVGAAGVAAIVISGKLVNATQGLHEIQIANPGTLNVGQEGILKATLKDRNGHDVKGIDPSWESSDTDRLQVDKATGKFKAGPNTGPVNVTATADSVSDTVSVTINPTPGHTGETTG